MTLGRFNLVKPGVKSKRKKKRKVAFYDLRINERLVGRVPKQLYNQITWVWKFFDSKYESLVDRYRKATKDTEPHVIITTCLRIVADIHPITPEYCKERIYLDRFLLAKDIPSKRDIGQYAKEAAHYSIMQETKQKLTRIDKKEIRKNLIREMVKEHGSHNITLITDLVHERLAGPKNKRDTTYRAVKAHIEQREGKI